MNWKLTSLVAAVIATPALVLGQADPAKVLSDMRAAIGGDAVAAVKTLTAEGTIQRVTPRGTVERTIEIAIALPDKYVARTQLTDQGNMSVYRNAGFNGDGLINETEAPPNLAAAGRDRLASDRPAVPPTEEQQAAVSLRMILNVKRDFARLAFGVLGSSFDGFPLQFSYAGLAESPDGSAHAIVARGANDFEARLFVDATSHLPLMMMWSETRPPARGAEGGAPTVVEHRMYYSDFKAVGGVKLPHVLRHSVDGNVTEETTFKAWKVNPTIDARKFEISK